MADEVNMKDAQNYPKWKIVAWRFLRSAVAGGASSVVAVSIILKPDLSNINDYLFAIFAAFLSGFVAALGKVVRDNWGRETKDGLVDKITIF